MIAHATSTAAAESRTLRPVSELAIGRTGREIAASIPSRRRRPFRACSDQATVRLGGRPELRAALFRLVDVAPACRDRRELAAHLEALLAADARSPRVSAMVSRLSGHALGASAVGAGADAMVRAMSRRFIVGRDVDAAEPTLRRLWDRGVASSVDLLGEATVTAVEADAYAALCESALRRLASRAGHWPARPRLDADRTGSVCRVHLSVKITALTPVVRDDAPERGIRDAAARLRTILRTARGVGAHVHVDMESRASCDLTTELMMELLSEREFRNGPSAGLVQQAYLVDAEDRLKSLLDWVSRTPRAKPLVVRLVKGAYWDQEQVEAGQMGWTTPVYDVRAETDRCFERMTLRLLAARPRVRVAIASHNIRSLAHAIEADRTLGGSSGDVELQVLRGLGDDLQEALTSIGHRVRTYTPVGDTVAGMAYLVRRLLENSANDSFLADRARGANLDDLLRRP